MRSFFTACNKLFYALLVLAIVFLSACSAAGGSFNQSSTNRPANNQGEPTSRPVSQAEATRRPTREAPTQRPTREAPTQRPTRVESASPVAAAGAALVPNIGRIGGFDTIYFEDLPPEAHETLELIAAGGPFPYRQDDTTFQNRERLLPRQSSGYYREYTVETPGLSHRGARRIVAGREGELFYTDDHYESFRQVLP
jgi:ribonuclease T1